MHREETEDSFHILHGILLGFPEMSELHGIWGGVSSKFTKSLGESTHFGPASSGFILPKTCGMDSSE